MTYFGHRSAYRVERTFNLNYALACTSYRPHIHLLSPFSQICFVVDIPVICSTEMKSPWSCGGWWCRLVYFLSSDVHLRPRSAPHIPTIRRVQPPDDRRNHHASSVWQFMKRGGYFRHSNVCHTIQTVILASTTYELWTSSSETLRGKLCSI